MILLSLIAVDFEWRSSTSRLLSFDSVVFFSSSVANRFDMLKLDRFVAAGVAVVLVADGGGT